MTQASTRTSERSIEGKPGKSVSLTDRQVALIEQALAEVDDFGEVRLIVEKSRLRFLVTVKSSDVLKIQFEESR